jgi:hypothetical protein
MLVMPKMNRLLFCLASEALSKHHPVAGQLMYLHYHSLAAYLKVQFGFAGL